eukprot:11226307-Lingulodinium_polyedra.AAC.1
MAWHCVGWCWAEPEAPALAWWPATAAQYPPARLAGLLARSVGARGGVRLRAEVGRSADCDTAFAPCSAGGHQRHER